MSRYCIVGAGKQGVAAAYYLSTYCDASRITIVDNVSWRAMQAVEQLKEFSDVSARTEFFHVWCAQPEDLKNYVRGHDVLISALPHNYNLWATKAALDAGVSYCDYGFDANIVKEQTRLSIALQAIEKGITILPNCGVGPGLVNIIALGGAKEFQCDTVRVYIGGNPLCPVNALRYEKSFAGIAHEYAGSVTVLEGGELVTKEVPTDCERISIAGFSEPFEAFLAQTAFGLTAKALQRCGVKNAFEKTLRFPGHYSVIKSLADLGFFSKDPVTLRNKEIVPFELTSLLFEKNLPESKEDFLVFLVVFEKAGKTLGSVSSTVRFDAINGLTAMQRSTSSVVAALAKMIADKNVLSGAYLPEEVIAYRPLLETLMRFGIPITMSSI